MTLTDPTTVTPLAAPATKLNVHQADAERARARFAADTESHKMRILHDDGLYRHLRFAKPGTGIYHFDLITWPGHLAVAGDMGSYTFARIEDMFEFFESRSGGINPSYWAEKLIASDGDIHKYSPELFRQVVNEIWEDSAADYDEADRVAIADAIESQVLSEADEDAMTARVAATNFECRGFEFYDVWEWNVSGYDFHYLWILNAIVNGINRYRAHHAAFATEEPA